MKNISANFSCIDIGSSPINYQLFSENDSFRIIRTGFPKTKSKMTLIESVEFLLSDIRNLRAIRYFDEHPNTDLRLMTLFDRHDEIELPEVYKIHVKKLTQDIALGKNEFVVLGKEGESFLTHNTIYFDNAFLLDVKELSASIN